MSERVVIVGAGQAGAQVAISLRQFGFAGPVTLIGDEPHLPYQRPPLSKGFMAGDLPIERTYLRSDAYYPKARIDLLAGIRAASIERGDRRIVLADGSDFAYDHLVLCTGTRARRLGLPGEDLAGVFYLRTLDESRRIGEAVTPGCRAVIIGGGYIGLEVAASLRKRGAEVVVLEAQEHVLNRVVGAPVSGFFAGEHTGRGVEIVTGAEVVALEGRGVVREVVVADGRGFPADLVVIGIGALPNYELAAAAGLETENGIVVDHFGRTVDRAILAAGDVTNHPSALFGCRLRLESVHNAQAQGKAVAAAIAGRPYPYDDVPWFWSDQYDLRLQIAGVSGPDVAHLMRGDPTSRSFSCLHLREDRLVAIDAINRGADFLAGQKLIREGRPLDTRRAADIEARLGDL
jgi:3-phenylpropionate/trans-cinnamate dioxygenase ferredoxin reductase subunit